MNSRFYSALTIASAMALNAAPAGAALVAHWMFDDADPITDLTFDGIGNNNGASGENLAAAATAKIGAGAIDFGTQGVAESDATYFNLQQAGDFSITGANSGLTIAFWYKAPASDKKSENRLPVHLRNTNNSTSVGIELSDGTARAYVRQSDANRWVRATGTTDIFDDTWHHVVMVYASGTGTAYVYIDGQQDAAASNLDIGATLAFNNGRVGAHQSDLKLNIGGLMDDLGIWSEALTPQQIALVHGLGYFTGLSLADEGINAVLEAFNTQGQAEAGGVQWAYASGLTGPIGTIGGSIDGYNAFIVLDANGNGVQVVPEPTGALLGAGMLLALGRRSRRCPKQD